MKTIAKRLLGKSDTNIGRSELNERIRKEYSGSDQLFDIAAIESTSPVGGSVIFAYKGRNYPCMYPGYTTDGGHLNEEGKRIAAAGLLHLLSRIAR
jgi:hypothetical protein